jgi:hypothetical protein
MAYVILAGLDFAYLVKLLNRVFSQAFKSSFSSDPREVWRRPSTYLSLLTVTIFLGLTFHRVVAYSPPPPTISLYDVDAMAWLKENTEPDLVIVTRENEGYWLGALAERTSVVGGYYSSFTDIFTQLSDVHKIYRGKPSPEDVENIMRS